MNTATPGRVLIIGPDPLARAGLAAILAGMPNLTIVGQGEPSAGLADLTAVFAPDVVLWDLGWAGDDALALLAAAVELGSAPADTPVPVVVLVADERAAPAVWQTGVRGVLTRSAPMQAVASALLAAIDGLAVAEPRLLPGLVEPSAPSAAPSEPLTPRELEVLGWMAQGYANKAIARELGITEHTVKFHVNSVLAKLGAQSRTEAVIVASRAGLVLL